MQGGELQEDREFHERREVVHDGLHEHREEKQEQREEKHVDLQPDDLSPDSPQEPPPK